MRCCFFFFFSSRRRHTRCSRDWSSDVCSSDLSSLVVSTALAWLLMRWLGAPGIALGSSLGVFLNTSLHLYHLNGRIGAVLRGPEWRAFGISLLRAALAGAAAFGVARLTGGVAPVPRGVVVLGIFGIVYAALTLALHHPDAVRTWQSLTAFRAR